MKFKCGYCNGDEFEHEVRTSAGDKNSRVSNQCKCSYCGNFLKNSDGY